MAEKKKKRDYETEWEFSFEQLGKNIKGLLDSVGIGNTEIREGEFGAEYGDDTKSAAVNLELSVGTATIHALTEPHVLIVADLTYVGEIEFDVTGIEEKIVTLKQKQRFNLGNFRRDLKWDIGLTPHIPLDVRIKGGVGKANLDLSGLQISRLNTGVGVGKVDLTLPGNQTPYDVVIDGGVGELNLDVEPDAAVNIKIESGVGQTNITLPEGAAVYIKADAGLGDVKMPKWIEKISGSSSIVGGKGVWQTPGFDLAERQIHIHYSGGIGALHVS